MRHFFFPYANRGASLVHAHVCRKGGKITGLGVVGDNLTAYVSPVQCVPLTSTLTSGSIQF